MVRRSDSVHCARGGARLLARASALVGLAALASACPTPARESLDAGGAVAPEVTPIRVRRALDEAERTLRTRGLRRLPGEPGGFLLERRANVSPLTMRAGRCYTFVSASSAGIADLDLIVFDAEGGEVAHDATASSRAAARLCPPQTGAYHVAVRAAQGNGVFAMRWFEGAPGTGGSTEDVWSRDTEAPP